MSTYAEEKAELLRKRKNQIAFTSLLFNSDPVIKKNATEFITKLVINKENNSSNNSRNYYESYSSYNNNGIKISGDNNYSNNYNGGQKNGSSDVCECTGSSVSFLYY